MRLTTSDEMIERPLALVPRAFASTPLWTTSGSPLCLTRAAVVWCATNRPFMRQVMVRSEKIMMNCDPPLRKEVENWLLSCFEWL